VVTRHTEQNSGKHLLKAMFTTRMNLFKNIKKSLRRIKLKQKKKTLWRAQNQSHNEPEVTGSSKIHSLWLLWTDVLALISSRHHTSFAVSLVL